MLCLRYRRAISKSTNARHGVSSQSPRFNHETFHRIHAAQPFRGELFCGVTPTAIQWLTPLSSDLRGAKPYPATTQSVSPQPTRTPPAAPAQRNVDAVVTARAAAKPPGDPRSHTLCAAPIHTA